jgi:hypothetical protein
MRAYLRTTWLAIRRPAQLAAEIARPVSLDDALAFRRVTTAVIALPFILVALIAVLSSGVMPMSSAVSMPREFGAEWVAIPFLAASGWFFVLTAAGVQSYWFHPSSIPVVRQNRAVALSYYATAPLAVMPIVLPIIVMLVAVEPWAERHQAMLWYVLPIIGLVAVTVVAVSIATTLSASAVMLRRTTHCGAARVVSLVVGLPIAWLLLAGIFLVAVPGAWLFVSLIVLSRQ